MPKVTTSYIDGHYYPRFLTNEEAKEYEKIGYKTLEISQETIDEWKEFRQQEKRWNKFWLDVDNQIWDE